MGSYTTATLLVCGGERVVIPADIRGCQQQQHGCGVAAATDTDVAKRGWSACRSLTDQSESESKYRNRISDVNWHTMYQLTDVGVGRLLLMMMLSAAAVEASWNLMMNESETRRILGWWFLLCMILNVNVCLVGHDPVRLLKLIMCLMNNIRIGCDTLCDDANN